VLNLVEHAADGAMPREIITRQVRHLARLVDDLLDVARVTSGRVELQNQVVDLGALVERYAMSLAPSDSATHRELEVSTVSAAVEGDPARLEQIVTNLVDNALKYTPPGGHVWVSVTRTVEQAVLRVRDDGVGIPADVLPRIFDLFVQADRSLDRSRGGLGLGLTLVKQLVSLHGGRVSAHSEGPQKGSEFVVELPLAATPLSPVAEPVPSVDPRPRRVLIVEDHEDARESLRLLLATEGHCVMTAKDGAEGLDRLRQWRPDVALVDVGLPGLDGYAVARATRADPETRDVFLVALTGYGLAADRQRVSEAGFALHLVKPVSREALRELMAGLPQLPAARPRPPAPG
jgi:CheY-like chemotaxis protein/two-component sensor histidine kinase